MLNETKGPLGVCWAARSITASQRIPPHIAPSGFNSLQWWRGQEHTQDSTAKISLCLGKKHGLGLIWHQCGPGWTSAHHPDFPWICSVSRLPSLTLASLWHSSGRGVGCGGYSCHQAWVPGSILHGEVCMSAMQVLCNLGQSN